MIDQTSGPIGDGGVSSNTPSPQGDDNLLSLSEPDRSEGSPLLTLDLLNSRRPGLSGPQSEQRAWKADQGLGKDSPGQDVLLHAIQTGTEDDQRQNAATIKDGKDAQLKQDLVAKKASETANSPDGPQPDDINYMAQLSAYKPSNDPNTIFEHAFANQFVSTAITNGGGAGGILSESYAKDPEYTGHFAAEASDRIAWHESMKSVLEDRQSQYEGQSSLAKAAQFAEGLIPVLSSYRTYDKLHASSDAILPGNVTRDWINHIYSLDASKAYIEVNEKLDSMNPSDALELANVLASGYNPAQQWMTNAGALADATMLPLVGGLKMALKAPVRLADALGTSVGREATANAFKDVYRAALPLRTNPADVAAALGDTAKSAQLNFTRSLQEKLGSQDPLKEGLPLSNLTTVMNPWSIVTGDKGNLSAVATNRLLDFFKSNAVKLVSGVTDRSMVNRLTPEAQKVTMTEAQSILSDRFTHVGDALIDYQHVVPSDTSANVGATVARFGKPDATLFKDTDEARQYAKLYGLNDYRIEPQGNGFTLNVAKHWDETTPGVRDALISTAANQTPKSVANKFISWARSADDLTSLFQRENRITAVHGSEQLAETFKQAWKGVGSLRKNEYEALSRVMEHNRLEMDPAEVTAAKAAGKEPMQGRFYNNIGELSDTYSRLIGRNPTEREVKAYFTARQLNDTEFYMRNVGVARDRMRQGIENFELRDLVPDKDGYSVDTRSPPFGAKEIKEIPYNLKDDFSILVHEAGKEPQVYRRSEIANNQAFKGTLDKLQGDGHKILQVENPNKNIWPGSVDKRTGEITPSRFGEDPVHIVVTKDSRSTPLDWNQIPYRAGWHTEYPQKWFVKQPIIRRSDQKVLDEGTGETSSTSERPPRPEAPRAQETGNTRIVYGNEVTREEVGAKLKHLEGLHQHLTDEMAADRPVDVKELLQFRKERDKYKEVLDNWDKGGAGPSAADLEDYKAKLAEWENWKPTEPKEPILGPANRHTYQGDTTMFGFNSSGEAERYAKAVETARQMMNRNDPSLADHLAKNTPFSKEAFESLFREGNDGNPALFHRDDPFVHVASGRTVSDDYRDLLNQRYANFEDNIRHPLNLSASTDKKFLGQRDNPLWTVAEKGSELHPAFELKNAETVDPMSAVHRAMSNIIRHAYFQDYKIQAVETWAREFGHLLKVDKDMLNSNPVAFLHNPTWDERVAGSKQTELAAAKASRTAILNLIGTESPYRLKLDSFRDSLLSPIYNKRGNGSAAYGLGSKILGSETDPLKFARAVAFHAQIGLFNPMHLLMTAVTMANSMAIGGASHTIPGVTSAFFMGNLIHTADEGVIQHFANLAETFGMKQEWFKESLDALKKSGFANAGGNHIWQDDMAEPKFFDGKMGSFLDKGLYFFKKGETATRLTAWNVAYREWRTANPNAVLTNYVKNSILQRADLLSGNMSRASAASMQQGTFAPAAQFMSYGLRQMDQMVGNRLTWQEKARVFGMNSALYGLPIAASQPLAGVWDLHEDIRKYAVEHNLPINNGFFDAAYSGVLGSIGRYITGEPNDFVNKLGPAGNSNVREFLNGDKSFLETAFGPSYDKLSQAVGSFDPFFRAVRGTITGDEYHLTPEDFLGIPRIANSFNNTFKATVAYNTGVQLSNNGTNLGEVNAREAIFGPLTGGLPRRLSDANLQQQVISEHNDAVKAAAKEMGEQWRFAIQAGNAGDQEMSKAYFQRAATIAKAAGVLPNEYAQFYSDARKFTQGMDKSVGWDFAWKKAPMADAKTRQQQFMDTQGNFKK